MSVSILRKDTGKWATYVCPNHSLCDACTFFGKPLRNLIIRVHYEDMPISNILNILPPKDENFEIKNSNILHISAPNIDCGYSLEPPRRGGSNKYPQSMFYNRNKKNNVYPSKPQFCYIKVYKSGV